MALYDKPECPFCWRARMALAMSGIEYEAKNRHNPVVYEEWERLSPTKTVPVLTDNDLVLLDSGVILEYLQDLTGSLIPDGPKERAVARNLVHYADAVVGKNARQVIFEKRDKPEHEWDHDKIKKATRGFLSSLPKLNAMLRNNRFFLGNKLTMAECALLPRFALSALYGLSIPREYEALTSWFNSNIRQESMRRSAPTGFYKKLQSQKSQ